MRQTRFVALVLGSGALSGLLLGAANIVLVEPYLDAAIMDEARAGITTTDAGEIEMYWFEHNEYRQWQKAGSVAAASLLGTSVSALYALVYLVYSNSLPGATQTAKMRVLAAAMWASLYVVPFIKYPPVLPGDGDAATLEMRTMWYVALVAVSGAAAIALHRVSLAMPSKGVIFLAAAWVAIVSVSMVAMPANPDTILTPVETLNEFRAASFASVTIYWAAFGLLLLALWGRFGRSLKIGTRKDGFV